MVENPALAYHLPSVIIITNLFFSSWLWAFVDRTRFSPLQLKHLRKCLIQSQYSTSVDEKTGWVLKLHYILGYNFLGRGFNCLVQFIHSLVSDSLWPHGLQAPQASLSITNSQSLLKLMPIESVMPSNHLILCLPLLLLPSVFPSIRVFSSESVFRIRWPKYWRVNVSISPSNEYSGLIS